jgi:hypothetical protein
MLDAFTDKPFLAIALIAFLIWVGVRAIKPRTIRYRQLYILPSVFLAISANQLFNAYAFSATGILAWAITTSVAGIVSWRLAEKAPIDIQREAGRIGLPGTRVTLSLILIFIAARLYFGRQLYSIPELRNDPGFTAQILAMTGIVSGYYLGRSGSFLIRYFRNHA